MRAERRSCLGTWVFWGGREGVGGLIPKHRGSAGIVTTMLHGYVIGSKLVQNFSLALVWFDVIAWLPTLKPLARKAAKGYLIPRNHTCLEHWLFYFNCLPKAFLSEFLQFGGRKGLRSVGVLRSLVVRAPRLPS